MHAQDFRQLAEYSADVIMRIGPQSLPVYVSPSVFELLGWRPDEILGRPARDMIVAEDLPLVGTARQRALAGEAAQAPDRFRMIRKDRSIVWVAGRARLMRHPRTGAPGDLVVIIRDITETKELEARLAALASTDGLTGVANRRAFDEAFDRAWRETLQSGAQMSLLLLDIDHFKQFNDRYGHQVGDDCLRMVARTVAQCVTRPGSMVARYGGEEFVVILPGADLAEATAWGERIRGRVAELGLTHEDNLESGGTVTVSIGAATAFSRTGGTVAMPQGLLLSADIALYKAKRAGRNRVETSVVVAPDEREV